MCLAVDGDLAVAGGRIEQRPDHYDPLGDLTLWDWRNRKPLDCVPLDHEVLHVAVHAPSGMVAAVLRGESATKSRVGGVWQTIPAKSPQVQLYRQTAKELQSCGPAHELDTGGYTTQANLAVVACLGRTFLCFSLAQPQPQPGRLALYKFCHPLEHHSEVDSLRGTLMASDGEATVAHATGGTLCVWKAQAVGERVRFQGQVTVCTDFMPFLQSRIGAVSVGTGCVAASAGHEVRVYHIATCGLLATVQADHHVHSLALRMDWGLLLCGGKADGSIILYAVDSQATTPPAKVGSLSGHRGAVTSIAMLDERVLLSGSLSHDGARSLLRSDMPMRMSLGE